MKNLKKLSKELLNTELIDMYKSNPNTTLKTELIYRAKNQNPFVCLDGKTANFKLMEFVEKITIKK